MFIVKILFICSAMLIAITSWFIMKFLNELSARVNQINRSTVEDSYRADLIGEIDIDQVDSLSLAKKYFEEFNLLVSRNSVIRWYEEKVRQPSSLPRSNLRVESAATTGALKYTEMPVQRAFWTIHNCSSARQVMDFITSPQGFLVIDPMTPLEEHYRPPLLSYPVPTTSIDWTDGGLMELRQAFTTLFGPLAQRYFLIFNVFNRLAGIFVSKSVLSKTCPALNTTALRALNTFGLRVVDVPSSSVSDQSPDASVHSCAVEAIDFIDLQIPLPVGYWIGVNFFTGLAERLQRAVTEGQHMKQWAEE